MLSGSVILFYFFQDGIKSINILGTEIDSGPGHSSIWGVLFFVLLYQVARFFQVFNLSELKDGFVYREKRESLVYWLSVVRVKREIDHKILGEGSIPFPENVIPSVISNWKWQAIPEYEGADLGESVLHEQEYLREVIRRKLRFDARVTYVVEYQISDKFFTTSGEFNYPIRPASWVLRLASLMAFFWMLLFQRWATDYILPPLLALIALLFAIFGFWDLSQLPL